MHNKLLIIVILNYRVRALYRAHNSRRPAIAFCIFDPVTLIFDLLTVNEVSYDGLSMCQVLFGEF